MEEGFGNRIGHTSHGPDRSSGTYCLKAHDAQEDVGDDGASGSREDREPRSEPISQGAVDEEGERVHERADPEDHAEVARVHQVQLSELVLAHRQVVASHVEERVDEPEGEPVPAPPPFVGRGVAD